jgi:Tfp pilus assembly protein PilF
MNARPAVRSTASLTHCDVLRVVAAGCFLLVATSSLAQGEGDKDYYHANDRNEDAQALRNVEQYHLEQGVSKMKAGQYSGAHADFAFMLGYFPNHPQALALMSELCDLKWKDFRKDFQCDMESRFERAIARNPNASPTFLVYGLHLQRVNRLPQAIESYKKSIALYPESANAHYNLGLAYFDAKQFDLANRHANLSYALGMRLPGLRDKLMRAGKWNALDPNEVTSLLDAYKAEAYKADATDAKASSADAKASPADSKASSADAKASPADAKAKSADAKPK